MPPMKKSKSTKVIDKEISKVLKRRGLTAEVKLLDNTQTITNLPKSDGPAYLTLLNNVVGGSAEAQRTGNIIRMQRIRFKLAIAPKNLAQTADSPTNVRGCYVSVRIMIVQDKQQIGDTTPALSDIIAASVSSDLPAISPQTVLQQKRFKILYDKLKFCEISKNFHVFSKVVKLKRDAIYNGTASTDIQKNGIYLVAYYNDYGIPQTAATSINEGPRFMYWSRLEYTDA